MKQPWFKSWGWIYRPVSPVGWTLCLVCLVLILHVFFLIDRSAHSASDTLIGVFPWAWIFLATLGWIASKSSK